MELDPLPRGEYRGSILKLTQPIAEQTAPFPPRTDIIFVSRNYRGLPGILMGLQQADMSSNKVPDGKPLAYYLKGLPERIEELMEQYKLQESQATTLAHYEIGESLDRDEMALLKRLFTKNPNLWREMGSEKRREAILTERNLHPKLRHIDTSWAGDKPDTSNK